MITQDMLDEIRAVSEQNARREAERVRTPQRFRYREQIASPWMFGVVFPKPHGWMVVTDTGGYAACVPRSWEGIRYLIGDVVVLEWIDGDILPLQCENGRLQQIAANRLTTPQDVIAILLQGFVRPLRELSTGRPTTDVAMRLERRVI